MPHANDPTGPTTAQAAQEARDAELERTVVIPFIGALLDMWAARDAFFARLPETRAYFDTISALDAGLVEAVDCLRGELNEDGMSDEAVYRWHQILRDPAKTAAWYKGWRAANPMRLVETRA